MGAERQQPITRTDNGLWSYIAVLAISLLALTLLGVIGVFLSYRDNLRALQRVGDLCLPSSSFDSIRAAAMLGRLDLVIMLVAIIAIMFAVAAMMGFRIFHREVLAEARAAAAEAAGPVAERVAADTTRDLANTVFSGTSAVVGTHVDPASYQPSDVPVAPEGGEASK